MFYGNALFVIQSCLAVCDSMDCSMSFTISKSLLKLMYIELVMPSNHLILCHPCSSCPQSFPASGSLLMSWLFSSQSKYWSFSFSNNPSSEYSGLISVRINWFDLPAVQGPLKSLLQHHISKASIIQCSAFFFFQYKFIYFNWRLIILQYCIGFAIHQHESATGIHVFS